MSSMDLVFKWIPESRTLPGTYASYTPAPLGDGKIGATRDYREAVQFDQRADCDAWIRHHGVVGEWKSEQRGFYDYVAFDIESPAPVSSGDDQEGDAGPPQARSVPAPQAPPAPPTP